jgi:hypothetical protein
MLPSDGLRLLLRLRRRGRESMAAESLPQHNSDLSLFKGKPDWNLTTAMADDAIRYLRRIHQIDLQNHSSSSMRLAQTTHRITPPKSGLKRLKRCTCLTRAGMHSVSRYSRNSKRRCATTSPASRATPSGTARPGSVQTSAVRLTADLLPSLIVCPRCIYAPSISGSNEFWRVYVFPTNGQTTICFVTVVYVTAPHPDFIPRHFTVNP